MTPEANVRYAMWDPAFCKSGDTWHIFCLAYDRSAYSWSDGPFWQQGHFVLWFSSDDLVHWTERGIVTRPRENERFCAGSVFEQNGSLHLLLSSTVIYDSWRLDQRLVYLIGDEEHGFAEVGLGFQPRLPMFATKRFVGQEPIFGCRDPFVIDQGGLQPKLVFITSGGRRWGVPPRIICARFDQECDRKIRPISVAVDDTKWAGVSALNELERVSVFPVGDEWWMVGSCWEQWVHPTVRQKLRDVCEEVTDSTLWLLKASRPEGPYELQWDVPVLQGSSGLGVYGTHIRYRGIPIGIGWDTRSQTIAMDKVFTIDTDTQSVHV